MLSLSPTPWFARCSTAFALFASLGLGACADGEVGRGGETDTDGDPTGADDADDDRDPQTSGSADTDNDRGDDSSDDDGDDDESGSTGDEGQHHGAVDDYIIGLGTPSLPASEVAEGEPSEPEPSGEYMCSSTDLSRTQQFDEIVAFAANSGSMFPGALIGGHSIGDGTLTPKVLPRAPLTFSASLQGVIDGPVSATLPNPTLSAFREAMADILDVALVGSTPANLTFDISEVYSEEQLSLALGLDASWMTGDVAASLDFEQEERRSRFIVNFTQSYYTVDIDPPGRPSDMLDPTVGVDEVTDVLLDEPPAYVSSVTYGRIVYFAITSNFSRQEVQAALDFGFTSGAADVEGSVSLTHSEILDESQITAFILGGNGDVAVQAIGGVEQLRDFIESGGEYSTESPGAPIAYKLAYLADNSPAAFALTTDYTVEDCTRVSQKVRVALEHITVVQDGGDLGDELEVYGIIDAWDEDLNLFTLMERSYDEAVSIPNGQSWPQSGEIGSHILPVVPQPGHEFHLTLSLREDDGALNNPDSFGDHTVTLDFEDGWREDDFVYSLAAGDQQIEAHFSFKPVP